MSAMPFEDFETAYETLATATTRRDRSTKRYS